MHVPEENLEEYRRRMEAYRNLNSLGNIVSGRGSYDLANQFWLVAGKMRDWAQELRVPGKDEDAQA